MSTVMEALRRSETETRPGGGLPVEPPAKGPLGGGPRGRMFILIGAVVLLLLSVGWRYGLFGGGEIVLDEARQLADGRDASSGGFAEGPAKVPAASQQVAAAAGGGLAGQPAQGLRRDPPGQPLSEGVPAKLAAAGTAVPAPGAAGRRPLGSSAQAERRDTFARWRDFAADREGARAGRAGDGAPGWDRAAMAGLTPKERMKQVNEMRAQRQAAVRGLNPEQRQLRTGLLAGLRREKSAERLEASAARAEDRARLVEDRLPPPPAPLPVKPGAGPVAAPGLVPPPQPGLAVASLPAGGKPISAAVPAPVAAAVAAVAPVPAAVPAPVAAAVPAPVAAAVPAPVAAAVTVPVAAAVPAPVAAPVTVPVAAVAVLPAARQPAPDRLAKALRYPPAGAPNIKIYLLQWSAEPGQRFAFLSFDGGRATQVREGDVVGDLTVLRIYEEMVEFSRGGGDFLLRAN